MLSDHLRWEHGRTKEFFPIEYAQGSTYWGMILDVDGKRIKMYRFVNRVLQVVEYDMSPPKLYSFLEQMFEDTGVGLILADYIQDSEFFSDRPGEKESLVRELRLYGRDA